MLSFLTRSSVVARATSYRLFGLSLGMSATLVLGQGKIFPTSVNSAPDCLPTFSMPQSSQSLLDQTVPPGPLPASPQQGARENYSFDDNLQGGLLAASAYSPMYMGDFFGMNSAGKQRFYQAHYDGYFSGSISPSYDPSSPDNYSGTGTGTLRVNNYYDTAIPDVTFQNFTTVLSTSVPQNSTLNPLIDNSSQVQAAIEQVGAQQYGSGNAVAGWMQQGQTVDRTFNLATSDPNIERGYWGYDYFVDTPIPSKSIAGAPVAGVGRQKLIENTSPIPRDRVFVNYSYFSNAPLAPGGVNVNRVTPGFEKTFFDGRMSFEMRTPFATTLDSTYNLDGVTNTHNAEFGDITMYLKSIIWNNDRVAISSGLGVTAPTADDFVFRQKNRTIIQVENQSVHVLPFIGVVYAPTSRFFTQAMMQYDIDTNGNPVSVSQFNGTEYTGVVAQIGRPYDYTFLYLDFNVGYWTYLNPNSGRLITGVAPMAEIHVNQSVGASSAVRGNVSGVNWQFTSPGTLSNVNATVGANIILRDQATVTVGYGTLLGGNTSQFDGEFRLMFNWFFRNNALSNPFYRVNTF